MLPHEFPQQQERNQLYTSAELLFYQNTHHVPGMILQFFNVLLLTCNKKPLKPI